MSLLDAGTAGRWVLDPARSSIRFSSKHFWGAITVNGRFEQFTGEGTVAADGTATGRIVIEAASLTTKMKARDKHLRSSDFFDVEEHQEVVLDLRAAQEGPDRLQVEGTLQAAGRTQPVAFTATVSDAGADAATLSASLDLDRTAFGMTWSPLKVSSLQATGTAELRFVRT
jgi:polyisoprenoid-binding protein YceI